MNDLVSFFFITKFFSYNIRDSQMKFVMNDFVSFFFICNHIFSLVK